MWNVLARMYGRKKRVLRTYQIKRSIYALKQGDLSVASYYFALKTKWEELDYHVEDNWDCGSDHARHWEMEWMDRTFLFLGGLRDEFETIRSQILNCDDIPGIEDVYARVESEEQRRQIMQIDLSRGSGPSAFVSRSSVPSQRPARRCTHCHKLGHSADFCWDLHPEKRLVRGRPPPSRRGSLVQESNQGGSSSNEKSRLSQDQIKELQAYIGRLSTTPEDTSTSDGAKLAQALVATSDKGNPSLDNWIVDSGATHHMTGDPKMFQDYKLTSGQQRVSMADGSACTAVEFLSGVGARVQCVDTAVERMLLVYGHPLGSFFAFAEEECFVQFTIVDTTSQIQSYQLAKGALEIEYLLSIPTYGSRHGQNNLLHGNLLRFAVGDGGLDVIDGDIKKADIHFVGKANRVRAFADTCSKILFQYMARRSPLRIDDLVASTTLHHDNDQSVADVEMVSS
ncbi:hypothetical protein EJ110_NYTH23695 [Nymphaea thermarum]|nr:hypothetical protein EJ110_NYTH23695 [Nymphaea thermarum]